MGVSNGLSGAGVATFQVRFESWDDFLVEYTDQLRHGIVGLPLADPLTPRTPVRIRLHLPNESILYLQGVAADRMPSESIVDDEMPVTRVRLQPLSPAQTALLQQCVEAMVQQGDERDRELALPPELDQAAALSVLFVDDLVGQRIEIGDALRGMGLKVRVAENGLLALSAALKRVPDVILTDVEMPQMDGWSLLRAVRQRKRLLHVPVVFFTRLSDEASRLRGYRMGVDDYLPKTMLPEEIAARLHGVVARRRQLPPVTVAHGLRGDVEHVRVGSVLAFLEAERRSGFLHLRNGHDQATLKIVGGALGQVDNLGRFDHPHDRVFELLDWRFGQFEFLGEDRPVASSQEMTPISYLLMEHARREDEALAR